ncbi:MAG: HAMP domain-containing protein, partial [Nocardioidaceae bacterium]
MPRTRATGSAKSPGTEGRPPGRTKTPTRASGGARKPAAKQPASTQTGSPEADALAQLTAALAAVRDGDFRTRLRVRSGPLTEAAVVFNELVARNEHMTKELERVRRVVGRDGRVTERLRPSPGGGSWETGIAAANGLVDDLVRPMVDVGRVISAVARGDLSQTIALENNGQPMRGEFLRTGRAVNTMVDQLSLFTDEVTRVAREVGT